MARTGYCAKGRFEQLSPDYVTLPFLRALWLVCAFKVCLGNRLANRWGYALYNALPYICSRRQFLFLCFDPSLNPTPNAVVPAFLVELFKSLNLSLDLRYLPRREHGESVRYRTKNEQY